MSTTCCRTLRARVAAIFVLPIVSYGIQSLMLDVRETEEFSEWLHALKDMRAKAKVLVRI